MKSDTTPIWMGQSVAKLMELCSERWPEIQSKIQGTPFEKTNLVDAAESLGLTWPTIRKYEDVSRYVAAKSPDVIHEMRGIGKRKAYTVFAVILNLYETINIGGQNPIAGTPSRKACVQLSPEELIELHWSEMRQAIRGSHLASADLVSIGRAWGIELRTGSSLAIEDVLKHRKLADFIEQHAGFGRRKKAVLVEILWRAWAQADPAGRAGPPPASARQQGLDLIENLGASPDPIAIAELAMDVAKLNPSKRSILRRRFGLENGVPMTLEEIGRDQGVTRERIRQIQAAGEATLMAYLVSKEILLKLAVIRTESVLASLSRSANSQLIFEKSLSVSDLQPVDGFVVEVVFKSLPNFLNTLVAEKRVQKTKTGWWCGPQLSESALNRNEKMEMILESSSSPQVLKILATELQLEKQETKSLAEANGYRVVMGIVFKQKPKVVHRRCLMAAAVGALDSKTVWNQLQLFDAAKRHFGTLAGSYRLFIRDLSEIPGVAIVPRGSYVIINPSAIRDIISHEAEKFISSGSEPINLSVSEDCADESDFLDPNSIEAMILKIVRERRITKFEEIGEIFLQRGGTSLGSVGAIMSTSDRMARYAPGWWGVAGLTFEADDAATLCNETDLGIYVEAKYGRGLVELFPFWTPTMEYRWARWAEAEASPTLFQSLLFVIDPELWPVPAAIRNQWGQKKEQHGFFWLSLPEPDFVIGKSDFRTIYSLMALVIDRGEIGFASIAHFLGWRFTNDRRTFSTLALMVVLGVLQPSPRHDLPHQAGNNVKSLFGHYSDILLATPHDADRAWDAHVASVIERLAPESRIGWFNVQDLRAGLPLWSGMNASLPLDT